MNKYFSSLVRLALFFIFSVLLLACRQRTSVVDNQTTCIMLGYDSVAWYRGSSAKMDGLEKGTIKDSLFVSRIAAHIQKHSADTSYKVRFKILAFANVMQEAEDLGEMLKNKGVKKLYLDSLDTAEQKFFGSANSPMIISLLNGKGFDLKLNVPADQDGESTETKLNANSKNKITVILCGDNRIYAYEGDKIGDGNKYSYSDIDLYIQKEKKKLVGEDFVVIIKPTDESTYNNTVSILDKLKADSIENYAMQDLSKQETAFIKTLK